MSGKNATERLLPDAAGIARAAAILERGGLVALPTETVYGLAARADSPAAVAKIYAAKGRPSFNPLIVHVRDAVHAARYAELTGKAAQLAREYWPGPLTLVLPLLEGSGLAPAISAGLPTVALRAPAHPVMQSLLEAVDFPLAAPSANRSNAISPTTARHVLETLDGRIDAVLDGGQTQTGIESSIVAVRLDGTLDELRPGPVILSDARARVGGGIEAPGQMKSHYSPGKPMRLEAIEAGSDEFHIGFGAVTGCVSLSPSGSLDEAASRLYACLHEAALSPNGRIAVAPIPRRGIGIAINDRLRRAATPA